jgi:hypothetical protein
MEERIFLPLPGPVTQIAERLEIPVKYYSKMESEAPDLLAKNVNTCLRELKRGLYPQTRSIHSFPACPQTISKNSNSGACGCITGRGISIESDSLQKRRGWKTWWSRNAGPNEAYRRTLFANNNSMWYIRLERGKFYAWDKGNNTGS